MPPPLLAPSGVLAHTYSQPRAARRWGGAPRPAAHRPRSNPSADPLAVLRSVLASARRAGYPFEQTWAIGAEAALSYMTEQQARQWWAALTATERAWADAYARRAARLEALTRG